MHKILIILVLCFGVVFNAEAQKKKKKKSKAKTEQKSIKTSNTPNDKVELPEESGLVFGANLGAYFANKSTANFYNGTGENSINFVLNNTYYRQQILAALNNYSFSWDSTSMPQNMKYDVAFNVGFFARYHMKNTDAVYIDINHTNLNVKDVFTLTIDDPGNMTSQKTYEQCSIIGKEQRFSMNLGYYKLFPKHKAINPYVEFLVNVNNTKVLKNEIQIKSLTYSIMNPYMTQNNRQIGGVGYGFTAGAGYQFNLTERFSFDLGFLAGLKKINLGNDKAMHPDFLFHVRMIVKSFGQQLDPDDPANY